MARWVLGQRGGVCRHGVGPEPVVVEGLVCGDSAGGVELQQALDERVGGGGVLSEALRHAGGIELLRDELEPGVDLVAVGEEQRGPRLGGGRAAELGDQLDLVDLVSAGEDGLARQQLGHDAADGPHIHGTVVVDGAEQKLWGAVPQRDDAVGVRGVELQIFGPGEPKVGELELSFVVDEEVGALDVTVEDLLHVAVVEPLEQLLDVALDMGLFEVFAWRLVDQPSEVMGHVLKDHEDAAAFSMGVRRRRLQVADHDLFQVDDVGVVELLQNLDLPDRCDREPLVLISHLDLL